MENQKVSDSDLIRSVLSGNTRAYAALLSRYQHMVFTLAMRMLNHRELAEETTQDIFVKAYRSLETFRGDSKFSTWLYRIAYRRILDVQTRESRRLDSASLYSDYQIFSQGCESTWEALMVTERRSHLLRAIDKLSPRHKTVLSLYYLQELNTKEIAEVTDLSISVVKVSLFRAREHLKSLLKNTEEGVQLRTYNT